MRRTLLVCALLVGATVAVYGQTLRFDFIGYDDPQYVIESAPIRAGLTADGVAWAFRGVHHGNWHPLTTLSYQLDVALHGLRPGGFHLTNVVLHVLNTLLLFAVLRSMTGAFHRSAAVAALFALHPLHVESVAWISERKDVLSTFFGFLAMAAYVAYARRGGPGRYLLATLCLALSLMAKPMLVTLPLVFLLLDYWPLARMGPGRGAAGTRSGWAHLMPLCIEKVPLLALSLAASLVTMMVQRPTPAEAVPVPLRVANAIVSYVRYVLKTLWPVNLGPLYPHPNLAGGVPWTTGQIGAAAALLAVVTAAMVLIRGRRPYALVGWLWYLGTLVPVIGIVQVGSQAMSDRYTYVPLIGLFIVVVWGSVDLGGACAVSRPRLRTRGPWLAALAGVIVLAALAARSWHQGRYWRGSIVLLRHAVEVAPNSAIMHTSLGVALDRQGSTDEAIEHYRRALAIDSRFAPAHTNLGIAFYGRGELDEALRHHREAIRLEPDSAKAHNNLGIALQASGVLDEAIDHYRRALALNPDFPEAHNNLARALADQGKLDEAMSHYREALRLLPTLAAAHAQLARILHAQGKVDEAIAHYRQAVALDPGDAGAHNNLGFALHVRGERESAIVEYREALRARPAYAEAHNNLGLALQDLGRLDEAIEQYRLALQSRPEYVNALVNLGIVLHAQGKREEAIVHYRRALELRPGYAPAEVNLERALRQRGDAEAAARPR